MKNDKVVVAFNSVLAELDKIVAELNQQGAQLFADGRYNEASSLLDSAKTVSSINNNVSVLLDDWLNLNLACENNVDHLQEKILPKKDPQQDILCDDEMPSEETIELSNRNNGHGIKENGLFSPSFVSRRIVPISLQDIINVYLEITINGNSYNDAVERIYQIRGLASIHTIYDKCTRTLGLNTEEFKTLIKDRDKFTCFLIKKYPNHKNFIIEQLSLD